MHVFIFTGLKKKVSSVECTNFTASYVKNVVLQ